MIDTNNIIASFGNPPKEYTLFAGCEYLLCDMFSCIFKGRDTDTGAALIKLIGDETEHQVPISNLSPIPLTVEFFDYARNESTVDIATGIKTWEYRNAVPPYQIKFNGNFFEYSDLNFKRNHTDSLPVTYLSDIQAARSKHIS